MYTIDFEKEKAEIVKLYRTLLRVWKSKSEEDKKLVRKAFKVAMDAHKDMRRKSGEPFIYHPLNVAIIATSEIGLGTTSIICALLHDVVEDTDYSLEDIRGLFDDKITSIIDGLTKIKGIFDQTAPTPSIQAESFKKVLLTLSDDVRVILIKLADRLHNMRTLNAMSPEKQLKIASQTLYLYAPLANRLGLHAIKSELEDLAFKYTDPDIYDMVSRKLKESSKDRDLFISKFIYPIKRSMARRGMKFTIQGREKSTYSIWEKMKKKEIPFEEVYDLFAIRIVIDSPLEDENADCWKAYTTVTAHYKPRPERLRDWIAIPKSNGYEALHTTVMSHTGQWVEIQIRSKRMDDIAEKGYAAHWKYKESMNVNSSLDNWLNRIRDMIQNPDSDALSFIDDVKGYFFLDEISVFTPQGELRTLPSGSTVLDFAFAIHSEVGTTCIGAKVDKKLEPLNAILKNGQQVEILTSKKQQPKPEWLNMVMTTRAKAQIKLSVKEQKKQHYKQGKAKLEELFKQYNIPFDDANIQAFMQKAAFNNLLDLFFATFKDEVTVADIKVFVAETEKKGWMSKIRSPFSWKSNKEKALPKQVQNKLKNLKEITIDETGKEVLPYETFPCCSAIPGDDVVGFPVPDQPLKIHRTNCKNAIENMSTLDGNFVKIHWIYCRTKSFIVGLKILGMDRIGLINEISRLISNDLNLNIQSLNIAAKDGMTEGEMKVCVCNRDVLNNLIESLLHIEGVKKVTRIGN